MSIAPLPDWTAQPSEAERAAMLLASAAQVYPRDGALAARLARLNAALTPAAFPVVLRGQVFYCAADWVTRHESSV